MANAVRHRDEANRLIAGAKAAILDRLGLAPFEDFRSGFPSRRSSVVRATGLSDRLDARYHSPLPLAVVSRLRELSVDREVLADPRVSEEIRAVTKFRTRVYVNSGGIPFLMSRQLFQFDPIEVKQLSRTAHAKDMAEIGLRENMLTFNRSGRVSIGHAQIIPRYMAGWAGSEDAIRVVAAPDMNPGYLFAWLASGYGQELVRRHDYDSVIPKIDREMLGSVPIPILPRAARDEIGDMVLRANELRDRAWRLERGAIGTLEGLIAGGHATPPSANGGANTGAGAEPVSDRFQELADRWRKETGRLSSVTKILKHSAYIEIIELGRQHREPVLSLILRELRDRPGLWYEALKAIARTTPVTPGERSDPKRVREA